MLVLSIDTKIQLLNSRNRSKMDFEAESERTKSDIVFEDENAPLKSVIIFDDDSEAGDWVESTYVLQSDIEHLEDYRPSGYHPVHIGDKYHDGRYQIIHKLGTGAYSTVWLAKDSRDDRYVALKIVCVEASDGSSEERLLQYLKTKITHDSAKEHHICFLQDEFYIEGPNGKHLCLVTELTRCNVAISKESSPWTFPKPIARAIVAQTILGVRFLHQQGRALSMEVCR